MLRELPRLLKHHVVYRNFYTYYLYEKYGYRRYQTLPNDEFFENAKGEKISVNGLVRELQQNGIVAIPNYYSADFADRLYRDIMALNKEVESGKIPGDPKGNLLNGKVSWSMPLRNQGIIRISNVEQLVPVAATFRNDPLLRKVGELYLGARISNRVMISQYNEPIEGGCRGFHLDSHHNEYKAFVYLNDVTMQNGPHNYLPGSHTINWSNMKRAHRTWRLRNTTITEEEAAKSGFPNIHLPGPKGTVLLVDTRGIHQGANLKSGHRLVLMNYYHLLTDTPTYL